MPTPTVESLQKTEVALSKTLAAGGDQLATEKKRTLAKRLRRAQRKRRKFVAEAARNAPKPKAEAKADE